MPAEEQNQQSSSQDQLDSEQLKKLDLMLYRVLTPEARERINNIRLVNSERYLQIANFLINYAQQGKLELPVDDRTLKQMLLQVSSSRDFNITRK